MGTEREVQRATGARQSRRPGPAVGLAQPPHIADALQLQRKAGNEAVAYASRTAQTIVFSMARLVHQAEGLLGWDLTFQLRLALLNMTSDIETYGMLLDVALINMEIQRLREETAQLELSTDHIGGHPGYRSAERLRVLAELAAGNADDKALTDIVFFQRHPDRRDRLLDPADPADKVLVREWVTIRREIVGGVLNSQLGRAMRLPRTGKSTGDEPAATTGGAAP